MKKKQQFFFSVLMAIVMMAMSPQKMWADEQESTEPFTLAGTIELSEDDTWSVTGITLDENDNVVYKFVAPRDGMLTVYSEGGNDTYGILFDSDGGVITQNDDDGDDSNFMIKYNVTSGETYYIMAQGYGGASVGNMSLYASLGAPGSSFGTMYKLGNRDSANDVEIAYHKEPETGYNTVYTECISQGDEVICHATEIAGTTFVGWYADLAGEPLSNNTEFIYTIAAGETVLTAVYSMPDDYSLIRTKMNGFYNSEFDYGGNGWVAFANGDQIIAAQNNSTIALKATADNGSEFTGWTLNPDPEEGEIEYLSTDANYSYTVNGDAEVWGVFYYTGNLKPELSCFTTKSQNRTFYLWEYEPNINDNGDYEYEFIAETLPSESEYITIKGADYCTGDPEITYEPQTDGSMLVTIVLKGEKANSTYKIMFKKGIEINAYPNIDSRGEVTCTTAEGDEIYHYNCAFPLGTEVTITADPYLDCTFEKWMVWDEEAHKYVDIDLSNPFTANSSIDVVAMFKHNSKVYCNASTLGPGYGCVNDAEGNDIAYEDIDKGTPVVFSVDMSYMTESEKAGLNISFDGWYDENTQELVSQDETFYTNANTDTEIYASYSCNLPTPNGWATFCGGFGDFVVKGGKAYAAQYVEDAGDGNPAIMLTSFDRQVSYMDAVIVRDTNKDNKVTIKFPWEYDVQTLENDLVGNAKGSYNEDNDEYDRDVITLADGYTYYGLYNKIETPEFRKYTGGTLPLHKAVLRVKNSQDGSSAKLRVFIDGDEADTTTVEQITNALGEDVIYDLSGRRVNTARNGMYIKNGKKVMVK